MNPYLRVGQRACKLPRISPAHGGAEDLAPSGLLVGYAKLQTSGKRQAFSSQRIPIGERTISGVPTPIDAQLHVREHTVSTAGREVKDTTTKGTRRLLQQAPKHTDHCFTG
jgi:hypothetical protein